MMKKSAYPWLVLTAAVLASAVSWSLASAARSDDNEKAAPPPKSIRVAVLPVVNASQDLSATKIMGDILRESLQSVPAERATFLLPQDSERILTGHNELDRAYRLTERWAKFGKLDSTAIAGLDSLLQVDAILLVRVGEWENHRVPVVGAGSSHTTIGLSFACFDVRTMKSVWTKEPREQRFGQEIDPSSNISYDDLGHIQSKHANDPPRYEDVALDLVRSAFKRFPAK